MQSENFDKKIKDSLTQRPPGNDDPAWDKMEVLLDKHLPVEKKDRRRFFFILLFLFLLTGSSAFLIWQNGNGNKIKSNVTDIKSQTNKTEVSVTTKPTTEANDATANTSKSETKKNDIEDQPKQVTDKSDKSIVPNNIISSNEDPKPVEFTVIDPSVTKKTTNKKVDQPLRENLTATEKTDRKPVEDIQPVNKQKEKEIIVNTETDPTPQEQKEINKQEELEKPITENMATEQKKETKESQPIVAKKAESKKQTGTSSFLNNLFFSVSAGPDFSSVGFTNTGKLELAYGAGIGYRISNKLSLRTGFYSARKIYSADPENYYMPYNIAQYYPNLKSIDANCKVYEIPVMLDYTISNNKKGSWFVSGGVSTLLMKEEKYDYYFKPNYSPTYVTYSKTYNNENKHYFSQLNLAGGYTRNITKNISLRAEPYMKIAMKGVGAGKVKLNSGGVLFSAIIKPFAKK